jgi:hypothetical protein
MHLVTATCNDSRTHASRSIYLETYSSMPFSNLIKVTSIPSHPCPLPILTRPLSLTHPPLGPGKIIPQLTLCSLLSFAHPTLREHPVPQLLHIQALSACPGKVYDQFTPTPFPQLEFLQPDEIRSMSANSTPSSILLRVYLKWW